MQKYEIMDIIDQGAYGIVWKASNKETQQLEIVAIKEFKESDDQEDTKKTIQREIKMLKMLKSDHVVGIREAFKKKGKIYLIFEYFPQNLLNLIETDQQGLEAKAIQLIVYKIVKCLKFLHTKNVIHRDIKPQNILLSQNRDVLKLCDFGFARFIPENLKEMTDYVATRWYRSPQLLVGEPYHKPCDIFALGCIIGELVDGQPMFPGEDQLDQLYLLRKALGDITSDQEQYMRQNSKYSNVEIPKVKRRQPLEERYLGKIQKNCLSFMKSCLKMNSAQRLTAQQALKHPYLIQLSTKYKDFENDEHDLMESDRNKTVQKNEMRSSVMTMINDDDENKGIEESLLMTKSKKAYSKVEKVDKNLKGNYGSVDYSASSNAYEGGIGQNNNTKSGMIGHYSSNSNQLLMKKASHQTLLRNNPSNNDSNGGNSPQDKDTIGHLNKPSKKPLKKNMSEQKHLKLNLNVNVNINFKINNNNLIKKSQHTTAASPKQPQAYQITNNNNNSNKLPELKPKGFMTKKKDDFLMGIGRHLGEKSKLSVNGQSKEITKSLINRKLVGLGGNGGH